MKTSKSMKIITDKNLSNGHYLEDIIPGYTTIDVTGRESLGRSITGKTVGTKPGQIFKYKQYNPRTINVSFVIEGEDSTELHSKLDDLNYYLDMEECYFIFDDEPDKFYIGTVDGNPSISVATPGGSDFGVASGSFDILCSNPFKYSTEEYIEEFEINESNASITIGYFGTQPAYPVFETFFINNNEIEDENSKTGFIRNYEYVDYGHYNGNENSGIEGKSDCNYVAFMDDDKHILQFGNPETETSSTPSPSSILESHDFTSKGCFDQSTVQTIWEPNSNIGILPDDYVEQGTFGMGLADEVVSQNGVSTTGTILDKTTTSNPKFSYKVTLTARNRTASSVVIDMTINWAKIGKEKLSKTTLTAYLALYDQSHPSTFSPIDGSSKVLISDKSYKKGKTESGSKSITFNIDDIGADTANLKLQFRVQNSNGEGKPGELLPTVCENLPIPTYLPPQSGSCYLMPTSYGQKILGKHTGPTINHFISTPTERFEFAWDLYMSSGTSDLSAQEQGAFGCFIVGGDSISSRTIENPKILTGITIEDFDAASMTGKVKRFVNGSEFGDPVDINLDYYDTRAKASTSETTYVYNGDTLTSEQYKALLGKKKAKNVKYKGVKLSKYKKNVVTTTYEDSGDTRSRRCSIIKDDNGIQFYIDGIDLDTYGGIDLNDEKAYAVVIGAFCNSNAPVLSWLGLRKVIFTSLSANYVEDSPNYFCDQDILIVNTGNNSVYLNGAEEPSYGALGNAWESMYLVQGQNSYFANCSLLDIPSENRDKVLCKCKGLAYICCGEDDYDEDETYYQRSGGSYSQVSLPSEDEFDASYSTYFVLRMIDPFDANQHYYDSSGIEQHPSQASYESEPWNYYIYKSVAPRFRIRYREVFA